MNEKLASYLRHAVTSLPSAGGYLVTKGYLQSAEGAQLDGAVQNFLLTLSVILAAVLTRLAMHLLGKYAPGLKTILGGPSGGAAAVAMTAMAWGALSMAGALSMSSCVVGVDDAGNYSLRPGPNTVDVALKYLIRHEQDEDAKSGMTRWTYHDPVTGELIPEEDYAAWGIKP